MKKATYFYLLAFVSVLISCGGNDNKTKATVGSTDSTVQSTPPVTAEQAPAGQTQPAETQKPVAATDATAATDLCNCMNNALRNINPKIRNIIIKAGKSTDPETTLQRELVSIANTEEAQQIAQEFQQLQENMQVESCSAEMKKKYNLDDNDKAARDRLMKAAAENQNCELVYALMKISVQQMDKAPAGGVRQ